jgi:DNA-binding IclR family transcriptional regulator
MLLQRFLQHEAGLRHAALGRVHQQQHAVDHLEHALDLAAEIGVARRVNDVDLDALVVAGAVFGQNRDAALALNVAAVHDALRHDLVVAESAALAQHGVHQRRFAVVNMGDDGDVAQIVTNHR